MKLARTAVGLALAVCLTGCTGTTKKEAAGPTLVVVAGGGSQAAATRALDAKLTGRVRDLVVGRDGIVRLLSAEDRQSVIRLIHPDGSVQRIPLGRGSIASYELAVADDGTMYVPYLLAEIPGTPGVAKVTTTGKITPVVGGRRGFSPDGAAATGPSGEVTGLTVDRQGRLVYTESIASSKVSLELVRRVEANGTIHTIAGKPVSYKRFSDFQAGLGKSVAPPAGMQATQWPLPGADQGRTLTTADDGTIYVESLGAVLAVAPDGTISAPVRPRKDGAAAIGDRPFTHEGAEVDAAPNFVTDYDNVSAAGGYLAMINQSDRSTRPPAYRWAGDLTPGQREIADAEPASGSGDAHQVVRLVLPDGSVTTAAWWAEGAAVRDGWLYVALGDKHDDVLVGRLKLPKT